MRKKTLFAYMLLSVLLFAGCGAEEKEYYQIPKSEIVDVPSNAEQSQENKEESPQNPEKNTENEALAEFIFYVENDPYLPNLDFSVIHNKARCDAEFESAWDDLEPKFGMTSVEDVLFHIDYWG